MRDRRRQRCWLKAARFCIQLYTMALLALAGGILTYPQDTHSVEYQLKAAFLLNFARFVEWPSDAFPSDKTPITFCVFRHDPFGRVLDEVLRGATINGRELQAQRINELPDLKTCQLIFVSQKEEKLLPEILNSVKRTSALVVGEGEGFAERGGGVQFFLENNKLRFAINLDAIKRARLQASAKLLSLARIVRDSDHRQGS